MAGKNSEARQRKKEKQSLKAMKKANKGTDEVNILDIIKTLDDTPDSNHATTPSTAGTTSVFPMARSSFTFVPSKTGFVIFGGEFYDTKTCRVFGDTYKWAISKEEEDQWREVGRPGGPKPRVGHAACLYNDDLYVFGGEFATAYQFYHFKDLFKLDIKQGVWTMLDDGMSVHGDAKSKSGKTKGKNRDTAPSGRSGHRMAASRNGLFVFGGFHDNGKETRYFNDSYVYWPANRQWQKIAVGSKDNPEPRSGFIMGTTNDGVLVSGGYSKVKDSDTGAQGTVYDDMWWLDLVPLHNVSVTSDAANAANNLQWTKLKKKAIPRAGISSCQHKSLIYAFGGVMDHDDGGLTMKRSFFFNDIWTLDLGSKQWNPLNKIDKTILEGSAKGAGQPSGPTEESIAANSRDYVVAFRVKQKVLLQKVLLKISLLKEAEKADKSKVGGKSQAVKTKDPVLKVLETIELASAPLSAPLPRINASIAVRENALWVAGGTLELSSSNVIVFDDVWKYDLKVGTWSCIVQGKYTEVLKQVPKDQEPGSNDGDSSDDGDSNDEFSAGSDSDSEDTDECDEENSEDTDECDDGESSDQA